jgi:hypothetical protein
MTPEYFWLFRRKALFSLESIKALVVVERTKSPPRGGEVGSTDFAKRFSDKEYQVGGEFQWQGKDSVRLL